MQLPRYCIVYRLPLEVCTFSFIYLISIFIFYKKALFLRKKYFSSFINGIAECKPNSFWNIFQQSLNSLEMLWLQDIYGWMNFVEEKKNFSKNEITLDNKTLMIIKWKNTTETEFYFFKLLKFLFFQFSICGHSFHIFNVKALTKSSNACI